MPDSNIARDFLNVANILTAHHYNGLASMVMVAMRDILGEEPETQTLRTIDSNRWPHIVHAQQRARMVDAACTRSN